MELAYRVETWKWSSIEIREEDGLLRTAIVEDGLKVIIIRLLGLLMRSLKKK